MAIVALLAQRLPVGLIPKQLIVSTVWNYVVNHRSDHNMPALPVVSTKRVVTQETSPCPLPLCAISTLRRGFSFIHDGRSGNKKPGQKMNSCRVLHIRYRVGVPVLQLA
jgi:hypothetical protein